MRPEFWSDSLVAALPPGVRLLYIGLWCVADDYGWFRFNETEIAALLFPYEAPKKRLRDVHNATELLIECGRLIAYKCGCALIPTLPRHQVNGGRKSAVNRDKHVNNGHPNDRVRAVPEVRDFLSVTLGNVSNGIASGTDPDTPTSFKEKMAAAGAKFG